MIYNCPFEMPKLRNQTHKIEKKGEFAGDITTAYGKIPIC